MKRQNGYIWRKGGSWFLRYYDSIIQPDGVARRVQVHKKLAPYNDEFRTKRSVQSLADEILQPINAGTLDVRSTMTVAEFVQAIYLPEVKSKRRASTYKNYRDIFTIHVQPRLGKATLRNFRCFDGERLLADIARQARTKDGTPLRTQTLKRMKSFLSGTFKTAKRVGALDGVNPMADTSIPEGARSSVTHAYSLDEIRKILSFLDEPARTVVLTAAYTGLRKGELEGLIWRDFNGAQLSVQRSMWNGIVNKPKTNFSEAPIPVVAPLRSALETHRERLGDLAAPDSPIFQSGVGTPMNLANLAKRIIVPAIEKCRQCRKPKWAHKTDAHMFELDKTVRWHGWHAFRRGLATTLHQLGTPDKEIQGILRHSNVAITQASYIKCVAESQVDALDLVAEKLANGLVCNENATSGKQNVN